MIFHPNKTQKISNWRKNKSHKKMIVLNGKSLNPNKKLKSLKLKVKLQSKKWDLLFVYNWIKTNCMTREKELYEQLYSPNVFSEDDKKNNVFHVPNGNAKIQKYMLLILMHHKLNMFNMTRIFFVWLVWLLLCFLLMNILQKVLLCLNCHHIYHVTMFVFKIGSSLPVIL